MNYFFRFDMWDNGNPIFNPVDRPESLRAIPGSTHQEIINNSGFPVLISFSPALSPVTPGGPAMPLPMMPPVHLELLPGQSATYHDHPAEAVQIWLNGAAPAAYAPVELRAW